MNSSSSVDFEEIADVITGMGIVGLILGLVILICAIVMYFVLASLIIKAVKQKGYHRDGAGALWFVVVISFITVALMPTSLLFLGIYAIALPDRGREADAADAAIQGGYAPQQAAYAQAGYTQAGAPAYPQGYTAQA